MAPNEHFCGIQTEKLAEAKKATPVNKALLAVEERTKG